MNICQEMHKRRLALGWSQRELASRAGVHPNSIIAYEKGKREPYLSSAILIFNAMGYDLSIIDASEVVEVEWIPCSERLPSEQGEYLVTTSAFDDYSYVDVLSFNKGKFYCYDDEWGDIYDDRVIAWMPLPKPWKGADDEHRG